MKIHWASRHSVYRPMGLEKVIPNGQRNIAYLKETVEKDLQGNSLNRTSGRARYDVKQFFQNKLPSFTQKRWWSLYPRFNSKSFVENVLPKFEPVS